MLPWSQFRDIPRAGGAEAFKLQVSSRSRIGYKSIEPREETLPQRIAVDVASNTPFQDCCRRNRRWARCSNNPRGRTCPAWKRQAVSWEPEAGSTYCSPAGAVARTNSSSLLQLSAAELPPALGRRRAGQLVEGQGLSPFPHEERAGKEHFRSLELE